MRELNPRAWSIDSECWCTRVDYDGYKEEWSGIVPVLAPDNRSKRIGEVEDTNIIVEFPTGIKDKNGQKIYEGDIITITLDTGNVITGSVGMNNGQWSIKYYDRYYSLVSIWYEMQPEVIGNIYENPELLER